MSANAEDPRLLSVAEKISDGVPVDWTVLQDDIATPEQSAIAEELRVLERVARISERIPTTWGRFAITGEIGRGAFGMVYRAIDPTLQLDVALKVIRAGTAEAPVDPDRALHEARLLVKVRHPNVVRAYGAERIENEVGLAMELIKGHTLDDLVRRQAPYSASEATVIGLDLCRALAAVHGAGLLHGDIKAHNVMREEGGRTVLMDFGAGRALRNAPQGSGNDFAGTPAYLAPEVFEGRNRTQASDIYSLGVLMYYLVTGTYPVEGHSRTEIARQHGQRTPRKLLRDVRPDLPDAFIQVVDRALAENPEDRYQSAGALEAALAHALSPGASQTVRRFIYWKQSLLVTALVLAAGAAVTYWPGRNTYRIDAALYREQDGVETRLEPGARIAPGDNLSLRLQVSVPAYVYVINEDEQGESFLLFPLPGQALTNPLPPGQRHRLPGIQNGEPISWQVTSAGRREHFLVFVSPERSPEFEQLFATLSQPTLGKPILSAKLSSEAIGVLRGVGGLVSTPVKTDQQLRLMPEFATPLANGEETARGVWARQATFENPVN